MESNIYYQLAKTECALERCKIKLFRKNLAIVGLFGAVYILTKAGLDLSKKCIDAKKERDHMAESLDKMRVAMDAQAKKEAEKSTCCDGHAAVTNLTEGPRLCSIMDSIEKLKKD